jgi:hypothetical protein
MGRPKRSQNSVSFRSYARCETGPYGVGELNRLTEQSLSEAGLLKREGQWYRRRPVMITRNDYNLRLFNGDIGVVFPDAEANGEMCVFFAYADGASTQISAFTIASARDRICHDYSQKPGFGVRCRVVDSTRRRCADPDPGSDLHRPYSCERPR